MRVLDSNGREVVWRLKGFEVRADDATPRSGLHLRARAVIKGLFATDLVYEEVPLPNSRQRFDFLVPARKLAVEVQGRQHYEPSSYMHGGLRGFHKSRARDRRKASFCEANGITLIEFRHDQTDEQWRDLLLDG